jgi:hypothetical protein
MKKLVLAIALGFGSFVASSQTNVNKSLVNHTIDVFKYLTDKDIDSVHFNIMVEHLWMFTANKDSLFQSVTKMSNDIDSIIHNTYYTQNDSIFNKFLYNKQFDQIDIDIDSRVKTYKQIGEIPVTRNYDNILFTVYNNNIRTMYFYITIINNKIFEFNIVTYT